MPEYIEVTEKNTHWNILQSCQFMEGLFYYTSSYLYGYHSPSDLGILGLLYSVAMVEFTKIAFLLVLNCHKSNTSILLLKRRRKKYMCLRFMGKNIDNYWLIYDAALIIKTEDLKSTQSVHIL